MTDTNGQHDPMQDNAVQDDAIHQQFAYAQSVQARYIDDLMAKPHVVGVAVGHAQQGEVDTAEVAIVVLVDQKIPNELLPPEHRIPTQIEGVRVDVRETGAFNFLAGG